MQNNIFKNTVIQTFFAREGYYKTRLFTDAQVHYLAIAGESHKFKTGESYKGNLQGMEISLFDTQIEERESFFKETWSFISEYVNNLLPDYEPVMINYWSKLPGGGDLELHQNWAHVDEENFVSISLWIPLQPTTRHNGTLEIVPRSQGKIRKVRGPGIDHAMSTIQQKIIDNYLQPINLEVGEVVFIDDSILHYTSHNLSDTKRNAIQVLMKPKQAAALFFVGSGSDLQNTVQCYEVEPIFFQKLMLSEVGTKTPQHARLLRSFTTDFKQLTLPQLDQLLNE